MEGAKIIQKKIINKNKLEFKIKNDKTGRYVNPNGRVGVKILKDSNNPIIGKESNKGSPKFTLILERMSRNWTVRHYHNSTNKQTTLSKFANAILKIIQPDMLNVLITLRAYNNEFSDFRTLKYSDANTKKKLFKQLIKAQLPLSNIEGGSDSFENNDILDTTFFKISFKSELVGNSGRKDFTIINTDFFKSKSVPSNDGDCLLALFRNHKSTKIIRKEIGLENGIKITDIPIIEKYFGININILRDNIIINKIIKDTQDKNKTIVTFEYDYEYKTSKKNKGDTYDVLLKDQHYSLIIKKKVMAFDPICGDKLKIVKDIATPLSKLAIRKSLIRQDRKIAGEISKDNEEYEEKFIFFDIETIFDPYDINLLKPYSISFHVTKSDNSINFNEENIENYLKETFFYKGKDCMDRFVNWIEHNDNGISYILIGYNNSRFDNYPLLKSLINADLYTSMLYVQNSILQLRFGGRHTCFDLCRFTMCSLKLACDNFKIFPKKIEGFSHEIPQEIFIEGGFNKLNIWIDDNEDKISKYNKIDVLATESLFYIVREAYNNIINHDILRYSTLAQLSYDCFKASIKNKYSIDSPESKEDDDYIRTAIVGGRCQKFCKKTKFLNNLYCVDVKSLYPFVMLKCFYPVGKYQWTDKYQEGKLGIYSIIITKQPNIKIEPERVDNTLNWDYDGEIIKSVTSIEIECLKRHGSEFIFKKLKNNFIGVYWENGTDKLFQSFFSPIKAEKTKQDMLSINNIKERIDKINKIKDISLRDNILKTHEKEVYNPALRNITKLLLNSLSGKTVQRNFENKNMLVKNLKEEEKFNKITKTQELKLMLGPYRLLSGNLVDDKIYNKKNAKPSYLGIFIYAHARSYLYDILYSNYDVLYTDTDSGILCEDDYNDFANKFIKLNGTGYMKYYSLTSKKTDTPSIGGEFGQFEEELKSQKKECESYIITKKIYCVEIKNKNGEIQKESKYRLKGVNMERDRRITKDIIEEIDNIIDPIKKTKFLFNLKKDLDEEYNNSSKQKIEMFRDLYKNNEIYFLCSSIKKALTINMTQTYIIKKITRDEELPIETEL